MGLPKNRGMGAQFMAIPSDENDDFHWGHHYDNHIWTNITNNKLGGAWQNRFLTIDPFEIEKTIEWASINGRQPSIVYETIGPRRPREIFRIEWGMVIWRFDQVINKHGCFNQKCVIQRIHGFGSRIQRHWEWILHTMGGDEQVSGLSPVTTGIITIFGGQGDNSTFFTNRHGRFAKTCGEAWGLDQTVRIEPTPWGFFEHTFECARIDTHS